jgi:hypothetical protein
MAAALPTAFASTDPFLNDPLHPSHQGYKGDKKDKQDKPGKPKDKHLTVVEKTLEHDHLWVPYTTAVGQKWIHAKIFKYDVSHELVSEQGTFYIGYEINKPTPNDPLEIKPEDVTVAGPYCVTVNYEGHPIDIILHEDSQKGKVP